MEKEKQKQLIQDMCALASRAMQEYGPKFAEHRINFYAVVRNYGDSLFDPFTCIVNFTVISGGRYIYPSGETDCRFFEDFYFSNLQSYTPIKEAFDKILAKITDEDYGEDIEAQEMKTIAVEL